MGIRKIVNMSESGVVGASFSSDKIESSTKKIVVQKRAYSFENRILKLLRNVGLKDVDGGPMFTPGGYQVDACGGYENDKLLIIECTMSDSKKTKSLRSKINEFRGKIKAIIEALRTEKPYCEKYRKYAENKNVVYVLATKNIEIRKVDKELAENGKPKIAICDERFVKYYENLAKIIDTNARYHLLGELGLTPSIKEQVRIPAFKITLDRGSYYSFMIEPQILLKFAFVARREVGKETYYQRLIKNDRINGKNGIRKFLDGGGFFPNNIIISLQEKEKFEEVGNYNTYDFWPKWLSFGVLTFPGTYRSCWIIDGQHRLFSFTTTTTTKVSVAAFSGLAEHKQAEYFVDINAKQKAVSRDLIWDLEEWLRPEMEEGIISRTVKLLDEKGIFKDGIKIPIKGGSGRKIKFTSFCDSLKYRHLAYEYTEKSERDFKNPYYSNNAIETSEKLSKALNNYFKQIDNIFDPTAKKFLLDTGGITVMIIIFERLLSTLKKTLITKEIVTYLALLKKAWPHDDINFYQDKIGRATSEGNKNTISREILKIFSKDNHKFIKFLTEEITLESEFSQFEGKLRNFVNYQMNKDQPNWLNKLPAEIISRLEDRKKKDNPESQGPLYTYLGLGEICDIMSTKENWKLKFRSVFIGSEFPNDKIFEGILMHLRQLRNPSMHGRKEPTVQEENKAREYFRSLERCILQAE